MKANVKLRPPIRGGQEISSYTLEEYAQQLRSSGLKVFQCRPSELWRQGEMFAMERSPTFLTDVPTPLEIDQLFWECGAGVVSYVIDPSLYQAANSFLYVCQREEYKVEDLSSSARWAIRRSSRDLSVCFMDWDTLLENGFRPFQETRLRVGLSDGGESHFRTMIRRNSRVPANHVVGAWKGNILAGFLTIVVVDGAVEIMGAFSMNDFLRVHPQDALAHFVLETFLREKGYKIASMGLSTIQTGSIVREGLHRFKAKVGFRPRPVRRVLIVHPLFRQLLRPAILAALGVSLKVLPGSRTLRKCQGALSMILNDTDLECRVRELTGGGEKSFTSRSSSEKGRSDI